MSDIAVLPVRTPREKRIFLTFPWKIFADDPLWVPPLLPDWAERMDPRKGVFFQRGTAEFFIAWRDGQPVGTICAAEDRAQNEEMGLRECVFGFFNFIDDYAVFEALLARAHAWARERGLDSLNGPFNLDYEDSYGILVEGRERPPALMCGHTPPYYLHFVERYGFQPRRGDNIAFALDLDGNPALNDLARMAERARERCRFHIRSADLAHWQDELERIYILLNRALAHLPDHRPWRREVVFNSMSPFKDLVDPDLVLFAEDPNLPEGERTIGWLPGLPNLNELFARADGLRRPWNTARLLWDLRQLKRGRLQTRCLTAKSVLVLPEYWGSGVAILMFNELAQRAKAAGYQWIDGSLTSADNPRTPAIAERLGAKLYKRYRVYQIGVKNGKDPQTL